MKLREIKKKQWWGWAALEKGGMSLWPMGLWGAALSIDMDSLSPPRV